LVDLFVELRQLGDIATAPQSAIRPTAGSWPVALWAAFCSSALIQ